MAITIQKQLDNDSVLSPNAQIILQPIPEGRSWFDQSVESTSLNYVYPSEADFLSAVLSGLHATDLLYIPEIKLLVEPQNLLNMDKVKLREFYESIQQKSHAKALEICTEYGLVTKDVLMKEVKPFLDELELNEESLFSVMDQNDYLYLHDAIRNNDLTDFSNTGSHFSNAAEFAIELA